MIEIVLLAKIWFWIIIISILTASLHMNEKDYLIYKKTISERKYESYLANMILRILLKTITLTALYYLIWGQK